MEVLKRNKILVLILITIVSISTVSIVIFIQNIPEHPTGPASSPTPILTPSPTKNSPAPTTSATLHPTFTLPSTSRPTPSSSLLEGEVSEYQGQGLTSVSIYIDYLLSHPDVAIHGTQTINKAAYRLAITGLVNNPRNYSYDEIVDNFNSTLEVASLPCVEGWSVTLLWQGVPISNILQPLGISPNATTLIFVAADGYTTSLPLDFVKQNNIAIAYKMNNVTLTPQTGFPFFLVAKSQYGYKWIEWLTEINVSNDSSYLGYWESQGYPNNATVRNDATQTLSSVSIITGVLIVSIPCIFVAGAIFVHRCKVKKTKIDSGFEPK